MPQNRNTEYLKKLLGKKNKSKELHFVARKLIVQQTWRGKLWKCSFRVVQFRGDCATLKFVNPPDFDLLCALCTSSVVWDASVCLWSSLGGPRRCSQVAGSQTWLDLLLDIFPHHGGVLVKASWRTQKCWGGGLPCKHMASHYFGMNSHANVCWAGHARAHSSTGMQGNIPAFRKLPGTLIHSQVQLSQWNCHTQQPLNPSTAIHCRNTREILVLAFTLLSSHTWIYVWILSCGIVAHTDIQTRLGTWSTMNGVHTQTPTHAHSHIA